MPISLAQVAVGVNPIGMETWVKEAITATNKKDAALKLVKVS